jgi:hypothetical protein
MERAEGESSFQYVNFFGVKMEGELSELEPRKSLSRNRNIHIAQSG